MTDHEDQRNANGDLGSDLDQLDGIGRDYSKFIRQRLIIWGIRWIIGFAIIWVIVFFQPQWSWLWWVGAAAALASLAVLLSGQWFMNRRIRKADETIKKWDDMISRSSTD